MGQLHLDSEYNRHFLTFTLRDGRVLSSCEVNWREVELDAIEILTLSIRGKTHSINRQDYPTFVEFVHFRTEAVLHPCVDGAFIPMMDREWIIGWTDGEREYCAVFDFATGDLKHHMEYERNRSLFDSHFHPESRTGGIILTGA